VRKNLVFVGSLIRLLTAFSKILKKSEIDAIKTLDGKVAWQLVFF
jgi:hypothetical protein